MTHRVRSIGLAAALACGFATSAAAEVRIDGTAAALHVTTGRDSIAAVLAPRRESQAPGGRSARRRRQRSLFGLARTGAGALLEDSYDFIVKRDQDEIEVAVLGRRGDVAIPPAPPPRPFQRRGVALALMRRRVEPT